MGGNGGRIRTEQPLSGVVICCTSVAPEQRTRYADFALQMGADHKLDLTSDVTHLLVGDTNTPKYKYVAREREDVKVLRPDWVEAVRDAYMADDGIDLDALEEQYRLPTFAGLILCITGFDDFALRTELQRRIEENGGKYIGDLTKNVTHLVAFKPEGKKYQYAVQWQKQVVTLNWLTESIERGMQLDEAKYHPTIAREDQGKGAWNREAQTTNHLGKRQRPQEPLAERSRKLRRTASAKLSSQNDGLWADISGNSGMEPPEREFLRPSKSMTMIEAQFATEEEFPKTKPPQGPNSVVAGAALRQTRNAPLSHGYMDGSYFYCDKFDTRGMGILRNVLMGEGATIFQTLEELLDLNDVPPENRFLLIPHNVKYPAATGLKRYEIVTELWVDACIDRKQCIPPSTYPLGRPLSGGNAFTNLKVNSSGFRGIELNNVAKVFRAMGASYEEVLKPGMSVLVLNSAEHSLDKRIDKIRHAKQWEIPVVTVDWLWASLEAGFTHPFDAYAISADNSTRHTEIPKQLHRIQVLDSFGKGDRVLGLAQGPKPPLVTEEIPTQPLPKRVSSEAGDVRGRPGSDFSKDPNSRIYREHDRGVKGGDKVEPKGARTAPVGDQGILEEEKTLQETSGNSPPKARSVSPQKKKALFQSLDRPAAVSEIHQVQQISTNTVQPLSATAGDSQTLNDEIQELLSHTGRSKTLTSSALAAMTGKQPLSRALSNVSNASAGSRARLSRAGSVSSVNTDGLGSEIPITTVESGQRDRSTRRAGTFVGRATAREDSQTRLRPVSIHIPEPDLYHNDLAEEEVAPRSTQLGYAETDEAIALRATLAEKRRRKARAGQERSSPEAAREKVPSPRRIRDDDSILEAKRASGRRTRQRGKTPPELRKLNDF